MRGFNNKQAKTKPTSGCNPLKLSPQQPNVEPPTERDREPMKQERQIESMNYTN